MWVYEKKLEIPVRVSIPDVRMAARLITQYGGPDGELSAAMRYLTQRYTMPTGMTRGLLTDIGTEELAHLEIIATMVYKLLDGATIEQIKAAGLDLQYAVRDKAVFFQSPTGEPWTAAYIQSLGDPIADVHEDMAAEQKARAVYEQLMRLTDDVDLIQGLQFLREREVVHFQRFGEALDNLQEFVERKKVY